MGTDERSLTVSEFCSLENLSKSTYHKMKKLGLGPEELEVPNMRVKRITPKGREAWHERMAQLAKSEAALLEAERRRAQAAEAGRIAAQSLKHVSRRARPVSVRARRRKSRYGAP